ncbi:hypothetical protein DMI69_11660 [Escherichia coli]|nr:hypothetical protein [Escherichia coli]
MEAHGTGTRLGDPVEFSALPSLCGRVTKQYCALGSVKPISAIWIRQRASQG